MKNRTILWVFVLCAGLFFVGNPSLAFQTTHEIYPTGDVDLDTDNIQAAIDGASAGDTILLKSTDQFGTPTPFTFGKLTSEDITVNTATGTYEYMRDWFAMPPPWAKSIDINKQVELKGEGSGTAITKIMSTSPRVGLVINAQGVVIDNIRFEQIRWPISALSPGFEIRNCEFYACYGIEIAPDLDLIYPNYPDVSVSITSHFRNNKLIQCGYGLWVFGSEITFSNNSFDIVGGPGILLRPGYLYSVIWNLPANWDRAQNNQITNNSINMNGGNYAIFLTSNMGKAVDNNLIEDNSIKNSRLAGTAIQGGNGWNTTNNRIIGNTYENVALPIAMSARSGARVEYNIATENTFIDCFLTDINSPYREFSAVYLRGDGLTCAFNVIDNNDYRSSGHPGIDEGASNYGCIFLDDGTHDNLVTESGSFMPGTGGAKNHVTDLGYNNRVVGVSARNLEQPVGIGKRLKEIFDAAAELELEKQKK